MIIEKFSNVILEPYPLKKFPKPCGAWDKSRSPLLRHARSSWQKFVEEEPAGLDETFTKTDLPLLKAEKPYLYGGIMINHFGHLLSESLSRLWAILDPETGLSLDNIEKIVFSYVREDECERGVPAFFTDYFSFLGIPMDRIQLVQKTTRIETLIVPEQSHGIALEPKSVFVHLQKRVQKSVPDGVDLPDAIYLSRRRYKRAGCFLAEALVINTLETAGVHILEPETISPKEQIQYFRAAKHIIAAEGSSLYNLMLTACAGKKITVLKRRQTDLFSVGFHKAGECERLSLSDGLRVLPLIYRDGSSAIAYLDIIAALKKIEDFHGILLKIPSKKVLTDQIGMELIWHIAALLQDKDKNKDQIEKFMEAALELPLTVAPYLLDVQHWLNGKPAISHLRYP